MTHDDNDDSSIIKAKQIMYISLNRNDCHFRHKITGDSL
jgi:hypothetical protein